MDQSQTSKRGGRLAFPLRTPRMRRLTHRSGRKDTPLTLPYPSIQQQTVSPTAERKPSSNGSAQESPSPPQNTSPTTKAQTKYGANSCPAFPYSAPSSTTSPSSGSSSAGCLRRCSTTVSFTWTCGQPFTHLTEALAKRTGTKTGTTCSSTWPTRSRSSRRARRARSSGVHV
jgi:hypothetical protein